MPEQKIESGRIATGAVTGDKIPVNAIRGNNIVVGQITGNLIGVSSISSNHISDLAVTGNELGINSVSSNNITANIQFNSSRIFETVNLSSSAATGTVNIDVSNGSIHYFTANTSANVTLNFRANATTLLGSSLLIGQSVSAAILLTQGATQYIVTAVQLDGAAQTVIWAGNTRPRYNATIGNAFTDSYNFTIIKTGTSSYSVLGGNTAFGVGT